MLLKLSGLNPVLYYNPEATPFIGVGTFNVEIGYPCSGLQGIVTFLIALALMLFFNRKKTDITKAFIVGYLGMFAMYITNVFRIYILILIGRFYDPKFAVDFWHSEGSTIFYAVVIIIILRISNRWLTDSHSPTLDESKK